MKTKKFTAKCNPLFYVAPPVLGMKVKQRESVFFKDKLIKYHINKNVSQEISIGMIIHGDIFKNNVAHRLFNNHTYNRGIRFYSALDQQ